MTSSNPFGSGVTLPPEAEQAAVEEGETESLAVSIPGSGTGDLSLINALPQKTQASLTVAKQNELKKFITTTQYGFASHAAPMICRDTSCPYFSKCPLNRAGVARPFNEDCPVETAQIQSWTETFTHAAGVSDEDPGSAYDKMIIDQIVFQMLMEARAAMQLAMDPEIEREVTTGYNQEGMPFTSQQIAQAALFYEKMVKTKLKLMRELLTTRKSKADASAKGYADPSVNAANMLNRATKLKTAIQQSSDGSVTEVTEIEYENETPQKAKKRSKTLITNAPQVYGEVIDIEANDVPSE